MIVKRFSWLMLAAFIYLAFSAPKMVSAANISLIVQHNPTSGNYPTIQAAINFASTSLQSPANANNQYIVQVQADPNAYTEPFTPVSNVWIVGDSTAGTFIGVTGTPIPMNGVQNVTFRNFTFNNGAAGISVTNNATVTIENIIFNLGTTGTAISLQGSPSTSIINNTFANNKIAISTDSDASIINDIFYANLTAISTQITPSHLTNDLFFINNAIGLPLAALGTGCIPNSQAQTPLDPLFVDPTHGDFHLQPNSPAAGAGNTNYKNSFNPPTSDMGAYGGPNSDILLAQVTGLLFSNLSSTTPPTVQLSWNATNTPGVTAYRVYYNTTVPVNVNSPFTPVIVPLGTNTTVLSNLPGQAAVPAAPTLNPLVSMNQALQVSWSSVSAATGYRVYYSTSQFDANSLPSTFTDVGAVTSFTIPNLTNGTAYFVAVAALAQTQIFAAVTAVIDSTLPSAPGTSNESLLSAVASKPIGSKQVSVISGTPLSDSPEAVSPYPNLKNEGCFIATAAFGFYSAPQVQVLRDFRDRYLLTNAPGRAFVAWYYRYGPIGAHFINLHPWLKAPVRLALLPLVVGSFILLHTPPLAKIAMVLLAIIVSILLFQRMQRKMLAQAGGSR